MEKGKKSLLPIVIGYQFTLLKPAALDLKGGVSQFKSCHSDHKTPSVSGV